MSHVYRVLRISFESRAALDTEYYANLVNGGLFISGCFDVLYAEPVIVFVDLAFVNRSVELEGCVVQSVPIEFEANGGRSGVAIELDDSPSDIRRCLEQQIGSPFEDDQTDGTGNPIAPRTIAEVRARVCVDGVSEITGRTRNLSLAGVFVAISDDAPPVGQEVTVAILYPKNGEERSIPGVVVRHEKNADGETCGIGIQFTVDEAAAKETLAYLNRVKASEHARRLGGISGSISTLGLSDLLSSFGQCAPAGRFRLMKGGEIGTIQIHDGMLGEAQVGGAFGIKAVVRMLAWAEGSFEFHATTECGADVGTGLMSIEAALLEATRLMDEHRRDRPFDLPRNRRLCVEHREIDLEDPSLSKIEQEILELAGSGMTVGRLVDTIQEPDVLVERCITDLVERGAVRLETGMKQKLDG